METPSSPGISISCGKKARRPRSATARKYSIVEPRCGRACGVAPTSARSAPSFADRCVMNASNHRDNATGAFSAARRDTQTTSARAAA